MMGSRSLGQGASAFFGVSENAAAAMRRSVSQLAGYAGSEAYAALVYLDHVMEAATDQGTVYLPKFSQARVDALVEDGKCDRKAG